MAKMVDRSTPVLVVDDSATMVRIIRQLLQQLAFVDVDDAPNGAAALGRMREKRYGLVISDLNMEPMTGLDLLKRVRANPALANTPFILVTAESNVNHVVEAKWAGVDSYIVKPFDAQKLSTKIEQAFGALAQK